MKRPLGLELVAGAAMLMLGGAPECTAQREGVPASSTASSATVPDAPQPQAVERERAGFWTMGDPDHGPIRTNREVFRDKTWLITQGAWLGTIVYDVELTHQGLAHHNCVEKAGDYPHPSRGQLYLSSVPEYAVGTVLNWFELKYVSKSLIFSFTGYSAAKHVSGGSAWLRDCW